MIAQAGYIALWAVMALALVQATGRRTAACSFLIAGLLTLSFAALEYSFITSDFSVLLVVQNSHTLKPLLYKITGVWGNHEGSMLLWAWLLSLYSAAVALFSGSVLKDRVLGVQGIILFLFAAFIVFTSNPFISVPLPPADGNDLNPLLQDLGLAVHPPMLYIGYVGFSVAFAFAVAGLVEGKIDRDWARSLRPWVLFSWCALTLGIALGSLWAYYELGWGGFWFWDPVENASVMPWLAGTALLHTLLIVEKRGSLGVWAVLLSILAFTFSLIGTFLVRSGLLTSVHSFALDPKRGVFILAILGALAGGALLLFALRAQRIKPGEALTPVSREGGMLLNNLVLCSGLLTVFTGTFYPVLVEMLGLGTITVGAPYFNLVMFPLALALCLLMGFAPNLRWGGDVPAQVMTRSKLLLCLTVFVAASLFFQGETGVTVLGLSFCFWLISATLMKFRNFAMGLAHIGFAVTLIGTITATQMSAERLLYMKKGDSVEIAGYTLTLDAVENGFGKNYARQRATVTLNRGQGHIYLMNPERRWYPVANMNTSEVALDAALTDIVYVVLGEQSADGADAWAVRVYHHPYVFLIWGGAVLMALGGGVSLLRRRGGADESKA